MNSPYNVVQFYGAYFLARHSLDSNMYVCCIIDNSYIREVAKSPIPMKDIGGNHDATTSDGHTINDDLYTTDEDNNL